ncbi:MAG: hypothetical protein ACJAUV_001657 [Flavobacteriales bacterium]|jgi:hypothetical protein
MTEKEALLHLGLPELIDHEQVLDAFEFKVFDFKDYVFKNPPISPVWKARVHKLSLAFEAKRALIPEEKNAVQNLPFNSLIPSQDLNPVDWLQAYQQERSNCFLYLQSTDCFEPIKKAILHLLMLESALKTNYVSWFQHMFINEEALSVLAKEKLDVGVLVRSIKQLLQEGSLIFEQSKFAKTNDDVVMDPLLLKEFNRLQKLTF